MPDIFTTLLVNDSIDHRSATPSRFTSSKPGWQALLAWLRCTQRAALTFLRVPRNISLWRDQDSRTIPKHELIRKQACIQHVAQSAHHAIARSTHTVPCPVQGIPEIPGHCQASPAAFSMSAHSKFCLFYRPARLHRLGLLDTTTHDALISTVTGGELMSARLLQDFLSNAARTLFSLPSAHGHTATQCICVSVTN